MGPCGKADDCDFFRIHAVKGAVFTDMYHTFGQLAQRTQAGGRAFQFPACGAVVEDKYLEAFGEIGFSNGIGLSVGAVFISSAGADYGAGASFPVRHFFIIRMQPAHKKGLGILNGMNFYCFHVCSCLVCFSE